METTALGVALFAGYQIGVFKSLEQIKRKWKKDKIFKPKLSNSVRKKLLNTESSDQKNFIKNHWESKGNLKQKLTDLWEMYNSESISYFTLQNTDLNDIVEIFIRVNNAGTQLSRTEMLMSTVSAYWPEARDKVDKLLKTINDKGFDFGVDFVMRSALVSFEGNVLYNPSSVSNIVKSCSSIYNQLGLYTFFLNDKIKKV